MALPSAFIDSIEDDGFDRTQAVKKAIEGKLKYESEITNQDGSLNANLFNWWRSKARCNPVFFDVKYFP